MEVQELFDTKKMTPAMRQYMEIKAEHPDAILFFRMGDFYEMFYEDAVTASKILGIALTSRDKNKSVPMCGIPFHAKDKYLGSLVKEGHKVALCEQMEKPGESKGVVKRAVTSIITPGTAFDETVIDKGSNNYVSATFTGGKDLKPSVATMDVTTGKFIVTTLADEETLIEELRLLKPSEVLVEDIENQSFSNLLNPLNLNLTNLSSYDYKHNLCEQHLLEHFSLSTLDGFGLKNSQSAVRAAGALLHYVKETQKDNLNHILKITPYNKEENLVIDSSTERNLDLVQNSHDGSKNGTLFKLMDHAMTPMGSRLLKNTIKSPLIDKVEIENRLNAVEAFLDNLNILDNIKGELDGIYDLERLISKVSVKIANPRDLISLKSSLQKIPNIKSLISELLDFSIIFKDIENNLDEVPHVIQLIDNAIKDEPPINTRDGGFVKDGYNEELDSLREIGSGGKDYIARLEASEKEKTGISTLKVGFNRVFGYYIEVSKAKATNLPPEYIGKQTLVNAERFITEDLKQMESKILNAEEKCKLIEEDIYKEVLQNISNHINELMNTAGAIAMTDMICSFATVAENNSYVKPTFTEDGVINIKEGRHPVIEAKDKQSFVPNDIELNPNDGRQIIILTGPNMAGKSTYIRQVALISIMAQMGSFVPVKSATLSLVDRVFTRVGASDDISRGQSTFMVEMSETANILNNATDKSLVILDEIGRGTSTFDGLSIAWAVAEFLHDNKGSQCKTLFATHYHELTDLSLTKDRVSNLSMSVREFDGKVIFLRKVVEGGANRSYGIQVARLAGLPDSLINRAFEILSNLEKGELNEEGMPNLSTGGTARNGDLTNMETKDNSLNTKELELISELSNINLNELTPMEALNILNDLKKKLGKGN